jgi:hypothetical protein
LNIIFKTLCLVSFEHYTSRLFSPVISQYSIEHKLYYNIFQVQRSLLVPRGDKELEQRFEIITPGLNEAQS